MADTWIINASPLILLARIGRLDWLEMLTENPQVALVPKLRLGTQVLEALLPGAFPIISKQSLPDCIPKRSLGTRRAGDVIPGSGGCRKVRWNRAGSGKSASLRPFRIFTNYQSDSYANH